MKRSARWPLGGWMLIMALLLTTAGHGQDLEGYLMPMPKELKLGQESAIADHEWLQAAVKLTDEFSTTEYDGSIEFFAPDAANIKVSMMVDTSGLRPQGYALSINEQGVILRGHDHAGLHNALQTLKQVIAYAEDSGKGLPELELVDWPDFERRGFMLDISRNKVPSMESLFRLVDQLAFLKINELQLYTEHTFAYKNHKEVWEKNSPMTPEEIRILDKYCASRHIDLVPNQNSFGHMENWLRHERYQHLAECPGDCETIWGARKLTSLNPTDPKSLELMEELYAELLPNFSSAYFNIGCDETVELGLGRSAAECEAKGKGRVYLDYLKQLYAAASSHGKKVQFWGDIILHHPELISELPQDLTAVVWGYDATYPFDKNLKAFADAGIDFYVCPGTSSWRSLIGKNHNANINLREAAKYGHKYGARGFLNTDWGDHGHWQPFSVSYPAIMTGAAYGWNHDAQPEERLEHCLNRYFYHDKSGYSAKAILHLGNAYRAAGIPEGNANVFHLMLRRYKWTLEGNWQTKLMTHEGLNKAEAEVKQGLDLLAQAAPQGAEAEIFIKEIQLAADLALHGVKLGRARLDAKDGHTINIPKAEREQLANELEALKERHEQVWVLRNRPGGLQESVIGLQDIIDHYRSEAAQ